MCKKLGFLVKYESNIDLPSKEIKRRSINDINYLS